MDSKYYKRLDLIRLLSCIAVLLYHMDILKGGYLAVCTFFVLSGYLSVISLFKKEKILLKEYYIKRLKKIYLPLLIVVFGTITVTTFFENINWINLKPETTSVLFGYNNFWQLNANLDYFVRHISSPFMHFWYIAIIIQFEIIFPFVFILLKKIGEKTKKMVPILIIIIPIIVSYCLFFLTIKDGNIMNAYYGTITRMYSLITGVLIGFIHVYYKPIVLKNNILNKIVFMLYFILLSTLLFACDESTNMVNFGMFVATIVSARLIDYGAVVSEIKHKVENLIILLSKVSYEIYLVQYPIIYLFQQVEIDSSLKILLIILITIILSIIIHLAINIKKEDKYKFIKIILLILLISLSSFGIYKYAVAKDYTDDMKKLEKALNNNKKELEERQKKYKQKELNDKEEWEKILDDLDNSEKEIENLVQNLNIVGIGDSVMELAVKDLYREFPNGYFDAEVNRTDHQLKGILQNLIDKGILGDVVVLNLGTNGECSSECKDEYMEILGDRKVFFINATNPDYPSFNSNLIKLKEKYDNVYIVDWVSVVKEHPDYLIADRVHPTRKGCQAYVETIYKAIYDEYHREFNEQKQIRIKEHEDKEKKKLTFIGNEILLGIYDYLQDEYNDAEILIQKELNYDIIVELLKRKIESNSLSYNIVLLLDRDVPLTDELYKRIVDLCSGYNLYIITTDENEIENLNVIDFGKEIIKNKEYLEFDKVHLSEKGNMALINIILKLLTKNE